jgi:hypothetical protein
MAPVNQQLAGHKQASGDFAFADRFSVVALADLPGPIGDALRLLPPRLLREADTWAELNLRRQERQGDQNPYPFPDPWQHLLDASIVSPEIQGVFRAAQSHLVALRHLCGMAQGRASLSKEWDQVAREAKATGDTSAYLHAIGKVADALVNYDFFQTAVRAEGNPELTEQMEAHLHKRRAQLVRKGKRAEADKPQPPRAADIERIFKVPFYLVENWICFPGSDLPGLMFWRNEAITRWIAELFKRPEAPHSIKKDRQRLGLVLVSEKNPWVWDVKVETWKDETWMITGCQRQGERIFKGRIQRRR